MAESTGRNGLSGAATLPVAQVGVTDGASSSLDFAPGLWAIFAAFTRIGLTSFGGGLSGWMLRDFVQTRRWISEGEFLSGLALAQAFPGVNVVNLSIWIGYRLRGGAGALVGALGIVAPAMFVAIFFLRLPLLAVVGGMAPLSIAYAALQQRRKT